jgi:2,4-dienoyl-CoA reductase-like NADH-dependent reductase (Old Yellow Enzyme family)
MNDSPYPNVFRPLRIGPVEVPNRLVRTAHGTSLTPGGMIGDALIAYHERRAQDGVGLTILELAPVHPTSVSGGIRIYDDAVVEGYGRMLERLREYPMKLFQQLAHIGHNSTLPDAQPPYGASPVRNVQRDAALVPREMTHAEIAEIVEAFAAATRRTAEVGLDGAEVHAAHGHLLGQFLSPLTNRRCDEYGGTLSNRARFLLEVMRAARAAAGGRIAVGVRLSASELAPGGLEPDDVARVVAMLEAEGLIDFLDLSIGSSYSYHRVIGGMDEPHGYQLEKSLPVARAARVPAIVVGRIRTLEHAERILAGGDADLVSMVRATIADPELITKSRAGTPERVRPCIGCNQGCVGGNAIGGGHIGCAVNPTAGAELDTAPLMPAQHPRRVVVVGGGPAGMEAARVAALRGHAVTLLEAAGRLGGQLELARQLPARSEIGDIGDWLRGELFALGVDVRLNTSATDERLAELRPDHVIVATGSRPRTDGIQTVRPLQTPIPGAEQPHVMTGWEVLERRIDAGTPVVVVDDVGHYEAIGVAEWLASTQGADVTFLTGKTRLAPLMEGARTVGALKSRLVSLPFTLLTDTAVEAIGPADVRVRSTFGGEARRIDARVVVLVLHNQPVRDIEGPWATTVVGDAGGARFLQVAITEGHRAAAAI